MADFYHSEFMGLTAHQDFRVVPVWELEARQVLEEGIVALVPFLPLMKGADDETIRDGVRLLQEREVGEEAEVALALFASFVMGPERVQQIVRWNMAVLRESPWYNQILEEGMERGREEGREEGLEQGLEQGLQQGLQQGVLDGQRRAIVHLLRVRFDPIGPRLAAIAEQLAAIEDGEQLQELLVEAMRTASPEAFLEYLSAAVAGL